MWNIIINSLSITTNVFTIVASGIAIYLFIAKRETISKFIKTFMNYFYQMTIGELRSKLDRLNDLNVDDPRDKNEVINIFNEIVGQIRGNKKLKDIFSELLLKMTKLAENPSKLTEPRKRSLISELRENIRNLDIDSLDELIRRD